MAVAAISIWRVGSSPCVSGCEERNGAVPHQERRTAVKIVKQARNNAHASRRRRLGCRDAAGPRERPRCLTRGRGSQFLTLAPRCHLFNAPSHPTRNGAAYALCKLLDMWCSSAAGTKPSSRPVGRVVLSRCTPLGRFHAASCGTLSMDRLGTQTPRCSCGAGVQPAARPDHKISAYPVMRTVMRLSGACPMKAHTSRSLLLALFTLVDVRAARLIRSSCVRPELVCPLCVCAPLPLPRDVT
jgi:hypothetical protein